MRAKKNNALGDMGRVELGKDLNLLLDVLDLVFCALEIYDLDRDCLLCALVISIIADVKDDTRRDAMVIRRERGRYQ